MTSVKPRTRLESLSEKLANKALASITKLPDLGMRENGTVLDTTSEVVANATNPSASCLAKENPTARRNMIDEPTIPREQRRGQVGLGY